jgi:hypothetical protein
MLPIRQIRSAAALAIALATIYAPAASAYPPAPEPAQRAQPSRNVSAARVIYPTNEFHWGDAGIGAAGGFALTILGLGGGLAVSQRRIRRASTTSAITK